MSIRLFAAMLIVTLLHVPLHAQDVTGTIQGVLRGSPSVGIAAGVQVRAVSPSVVVTADPAADGSFVFTDVPVGTYQVQAIDSAGRTIAAQRVRLTADALTQSVTLTIRPPVAVLGGAVEQPARFVAGPFGIAPSAAISSLGVDSNVFHEASNPRSDTAFILQPDLVVTLDTDRTRGQGILHGQYLYFDKYSDERSMDVAADGGLQTMVNRFTPWARGNIDGGRRRINHEIDLRTQQFTSGLQIGIDTQVARRTVASIAIGRSDVGFDPAEFFLGANLQEVLNRRVLRTTIEGRQNLSDRVSAVGQFTADGQRFRFAPQRDSRTVRVQGGIVTAPDARASGRVQAGFLRLHGVGAAIADYSGFAASADEDVQLSTATRLLLTAIRDIDYSYDVRFPYYVRTEAAASLLVQAGGAWEISLSGEADRMMHRPQPGDTFSVSYADQYGYAGAGASVRVAPGLRIGVDGGYERRNSPVESRAFTGYRFGGALAVGTRPVRVRGMALW